jgi:hypothetical protein
MELKVKLICCQGFPTDGDEAAIFKPKITDEAAYLNARIS